MSDLVNEAQLARDYLKRVGDMAELRLQEHLPLPSVIPNRLHEAMRYSMFAGGKRLRPALACAAFEAFHGQGESIWLITSALEMLHTFSLIHDDLPCMDDDDLRRGMPTAHKKYGEATAVLSGDALCIHAFELLARTGSAQVVETIAHALGTSGMIGGQMMDIESEGRQVNLEIVDYIHYHKTAALIEASLVVGAICAGADSDQIVPIREFGHAIGLAFQVVDDILDIEQTTEQLGKDAGSDLEKGKATYPSVIGLEASKKKACELYESSLRALDRSSAETRILRSIAAFIVTRVN
ncbi:MAG TPA: farnesyl diphosphate synthase [Fibrobacteraceae bacterium]|nr:farnesyl diphosphate synthase [Fibrobacteraceae bacterium]